MFVAGLTFPLPQIVPDYFQSVFIITLSSSSLQMCNSGQSLRFFYEARLVWHGWGDIIRNHNAIALTPTYSSNSPPYLLQISWCFLGGQCWHTKLFSFPQQSSLLAVSVCFQSANGERPPPDLMVSLPPWWLYGGKILSQNRTTLLYWKSKQKCWQRKTEENLQDWQRPTNQA